MRGGDTHLFDAPGPKAVRRTIIGSVVAGAVAIVIVVLALIELSAKGQLDAKKWLPLFTNMDLVRFLLLGLAYTGAAAVVSLGLAFALGIALGVGRLSHLPLVRNPCIAVIEVARGLPVLLSMLFFFLAFPIVFGIDLPAFWTVVLALTLYNGAVIAEIVRAGVLTLPKGQREAAYAMGLTRGQTMRLVLLPQALRIMLPSLISQLVVLIKDSALGFIVGYQELAAQAQSAALLFNNPLQTFAVVGVVYIVLNWALSEASTWLGERQKRSMSKSAVAPSAVAAAVPEMVAVTLPAESSAENER